MMGRRVEARGSGCDECGGGRHGRRRDGRIDGASLPRDAGEGRSGRGVVWFLGRWTTSRCLPEFRVHGPGWPEREAGSEAMLPKTDKENLSRAGATGQLRVPRTKVLWSKELAAVTTTGANFSRG